MIPLASPEVTYSLPDLSAYVHTHAYEQGNNRVLNKYKWVHSIHLFLLGDFLIQFTQADFVSH